jgi:molybdate transport system substrate-binding protein
MGAWRRGALRIALLGVLLAPPAGGDELILAAAVSLREPLTEIVGRYRAEHPESQVALSFGASSFLAAQIRAGAPVDVFASADERIVAKLREEGLVPGDGSAVLARNRLVVLVAADADFPLAKPEDLARPGVRRIAIPDGAVPVGRYAREWLARRGLLAALEERLVHTEHARATLAAVDLGLVDAAIVYATDAKLARSARVAFPVPAADQPRIVYAVARVAEARPGAPGLFAYLRGTEARQVLAAAGFVVP